MDLKDNKDKKPSHKNRTFLDSFYYAFQGVRTVFQEERNMRTHVLFTLAIIIVALFLPLGMFEWLWLLLVCFLVLVMEILNTVIENIIDLVSPEYHPLAKKVKDMAAAAVLFTSIFSVIVGIIIILPKILDVFNLL